MIFSKNRKAVNSPVRFRIKTLLLIALTLIIYGCSFIDAVKNGTPAGISDAVKNGADPNMRYGSGETPLMAAIQYNKEPYETAKILIDAGADVNSTDDTGNSPLHRAVIIQDTNEALKLVQLLLDHGADPGIKGGYGNITPLMAVSERIDGIKIAELLIKNGAAVKSRDAESDSALHHAASVNGNIRMIELLIKHGADVNAGAPSGTPLHQAAYRGAAENIKILIRHKAAINIKGDASDSRTPLETAVDAKQFDSAKILVENGADINTQSYYSYQPFKYRNNSQSYLSKLTNVDTDTIRFERMTPLHRAVTHNSLSFVEYLLNKGAKTGIDAHFGGYALDFALFLNYYEIADLLIKHKAPSLFADLYLIDAIEVKDSRKAVMLLEAGAKINSRDYLENTPLHYASKSGDIEIIKMLLARGADRTAKNREGKTPADLAADEEIRSMLAVK